MFYSFNPFIYWCNVIDVVLSRQSTKLGLKFNIECLKNLICPCQLLPYQIYSIKTKCSSRNFVQCLSFICLSPRQYNIIRQTMSCAKRGWSIFTKNNMWMWNLTFLITHSYLGPFHLYFWSTCPNSLNFVMIFYY